MKTLRALLIAGAIGLGASPAPASGAAAGG